MTGSPFVKIDFFQNVEGELSYLINQETSSFIKFYYFTYYNDIKYIIKNISLILLRR